MKAAKIMTALVALIHFYIMLLETLLWTSRGYKVFEMSYEFAESTKIMAFNQGWYNGFLAVGLVWSLLIKDKLWGPRIAIFFLACVAVAGIVGALSLGQNKILFVQTIPAGVGIALYFKSLGAKIYRA